MGKMILFCAGKMAERVYRTTKDEIVAVIDNHKKGMFHEIPIITLEDYLSNYLEYPIRIAVANYRVIREIEGQLKRHGIDKYAMAHEMYEDDTIVHDTDIQHGNWLEYLLKHYDKKGYKILELGSRVQTGANFRHCFKNAEYVGFDLYAGENVDIVGDAHRLSSYFDCKFDLIFSSAVFEHLAMPWVVSKEMIKLLKMGGAVFIETHYSFSSHERPWHFFQFSENALNVLFPEEYGMRCLKKNVCNLIEGKFSEKACDYLKGQLVRDLYCHSEFLGKKIAEIDVDEVKWEDLDIEKVVQGTSYPKHD